MNKLNKSEIAIGVLFAPIVFVVSLIVCLVLRMLLDFIYFIKTPIRKFSDFIEKIHRMNEEANQLDI
jgi:hypothetical protein